MVAVSSLNPAAGHLGGLCARQGPTGRHLAEGCSPARAHPAGDVHIVQAGRTVQAQTQSFAHAKETRHAELQLEIF